MAGSTESKTFREDPQCCFDYSELSLFSAWVLAALSCLRQMRRARRAPAPHQPPHRPRPARAKRQAALRRNKLKRRRQLEALPRRPAGQAPSGGKSPTETATDTPKGKLASPYQDFAKVANEGHQKFMGAGCNGCHGGGGGGGMGPPLTNQVWVYGKDDDTLFRLVALGSDGLKKQGYSRKGSENVVGPMPAMGSVVKSDDDLWKIIAWIRSVNPSSVSASAETAPPPQ